MDRTRLWILFGLAGVCLLPRQAVSIGIGAMRDRRRGRRSEAISLRTLLNSRLPGWESWSYPGITGQGIWSLPGYVDQGLFNILVNNQIRNRDTNVDTIMLRPGDLLTIGDFNYRLPVANQVQF